MTYGGVVDDGVCTWCPAPAEDGRYMCRPCFAYWLEVDDSEMDQA